MRAALKDEISNLASEKEPNPIEHLQKHCGVLLRLISDATGVEESEKVVRKLLYEVYETENGHAGVRVIADLLVLEELPIEEKRQIYNNYKRRDRPDSFNPYGFEVRKIIAIRHFGLSHSRLDTKKPEWVTNFVDALCDILMSEYPAAFLPVTPDASLATKPMGVEVSAFGASSNEETFRLSFLRRISQRMRRKQPTTGDRGVTSAISSGGKATGGEGAPVLDEGQ